MLKWFCEIKNGIEHSNVMQPDLKPLIKGTVSSRSTGHGIGVLVLF